MSDEKLNRREFFQRAATVGAAVTGAGTLLAACKDQGDGQNESGGGTDDQGGGKKDEKGKEEFSCTDTSDLSESDKKRRKAQEYIDRTETEGERCDNCQLYEAPDKEGTCGGCSVVPGPIHPKGWCKSWVEAKG